MPLEAWREQVLRELKGAPPERLIARVEGLEIEPLYLSLIHISEPTRPY